MDVKGSGVALRTVLLLLILSAIFPLSFSKVNQILDTKKPNPPSPARSSASTFVFPIQGNVYPDGHYTVKLSIGNPPSVYDLDIDSGSDLTWVQCAPCKRGCSTPSDKLYKLNNSNVVTCKDPLCAAVSKSPCSPPTGQCNYKVEYADHGSSSGVLVNDTVTLRLANGSPKSLRLAFGCGNDQQYSALVPSTTAGVLGLGNGKTSILSQLKNSNLIRNVVGHCLSAKGGGYIFLGDGLIKDPRKFVWTPISPSSSSQEHYGSGPADLLFNGNPTPVVKDLNLIFDSGSTYTYLNSKAYKAVLDVITNDLKGKPVKIVKDDKSLPICWSGPKPFTYFKTLTLSFTKSKNSLLQLPPPAYLIVTKHGNACLGILDSSANGLGDINIIGDISLQDKLVIYDNEKQQIGWVPVPINCHPGGRRP